jgi:hypothetical protein
VNVEFDTKTYPEHVRGHVLDIAVLIIHEVRRDLRDGTQDYSDHGWHQVF